LYIVISLIASESAIESGVAYPIPVEEEVATMAIKNPLPPDNHNIIMERNIFGSPELKGIEQNPLPDDKEDSISILEAKLRLLATVAGDEELACAVIENLQSKERGIYRVGEIIEGAKIGRIDRKKIILFCGEQREQLSLRITCKTADFTGKEASPVLDQNQKNAELARVISIDAGDINRKSCITQARWMEPVLAKIKVAPVVLDGEEKGLRITGLEDSDIAGYFGFENNDVILILNGQTLNDKQQAFQVLKKARAQSSLEFQLLRDHHKMGLSLEI
jgi:type II secretion system protein C